MSEVYALCTLYLIAISHFHNQTSPSALPPRGNYSSLEKSLTFFKFFIFLSTSGSPDVTEGSVLHGTFCNSGDGVDSWFPSVLASCKLIKQQFMCCSCKLFTQQLCCLRTWKPRKAVEYFSLLLVLWCSLLFVNTLQLYVI